MRFDTGAAVDNVAIDNGLQRAADLLQMSVPDVKNCTTILCWAALRSVAARALPASPSALPLSPWNELAYEALPKRFMARARGFARTRKACGPCC